MTTISDKGMSVLCSVMRESLGKLASPVNEDLLHDDLLTATSFDESISINMGLFLRNKEWGVMSDKEKVVLAIRLSFAVDYFSDLASVGEKNQYGEESVIRILTETVTNTWHRRATFWMMRNCNLIEILQMDFGAWPHQ